MSRDGRRPADPPDQETRWRLRTAMPRPPPTRRRHSPPRSRAEVRDLPTRQVRHCRHRLAAVPAAAKEWPAHAARRATSPLQKVCSWSLCAWLGLHHPHSPSPHRARQEAVTPGEIIQSLILHLLWSTGCPARFVIRHLRVNTAGCGHEPGACSSPPCSGSVAAIHCGCASHPRTTGATATIVSTISGVP